MAGPSLDSLPAEVQLMVFGFAYSDCQINITEHKKQVLSEGEEDTITATSTTNRQKHPFISKASHAAAWQAYLTCATWYFASISAASEFLESSTRRAVVQHIKHIRLDAKAVDPTRLLPLLFQAGCTTLRSVELINCSAFNFGLPQPAATGVLSVMQRDENEVLQHMLRRSCRGVDVTALSREDLDGCGFVVALAGMQALEHVMVRAECAVCQEYGVECDWGLVARKAELCVSKAMVGGGRASWMRERHIVRIEKEVKALENAVLVRDRLEGIDVDCGADWEVELESSEELAMLVG